MPSRATRVVRAARGVAAARPGRRRARLVARLLLRPPSAKRRGVASALLNGAVERATAAGAPFLEAYAARANHPNIDAYTGYLPMYVAAGFEPVAEGGRRTIVRKRLRP